MSEDGYTLVEVLAALAIIGLSITAAMGGVAAVGKLQHQASYKVAEAEASAALSGELDHLVAGEGPFSSAGGLPLTGTPESFSFRCGGKDCQARIGRSRAGPTLDVVDHGTARRFSLATRGARFGYLGSRTSGDHWPPDNPTDWQRLRAIALVTGKEARPIAISRVWLEGALPRADQP